MARENTHDRWNGRRGETCKYEEETRQRETRRETKTPLRNTKGEGDLNTGNMTDSHAEGTAL